MPVTRWEVFFENIETALAGLEAAPIAVQLKQFVHVVFRHFADHGRFMSILHQSEMEPRCDDLVQTRRADHAVKIIEGVRARLNAVIDRAIARGELRGDLGPMLATFLVSLCKGTAITHERLHGSRDYAGLAEYAEPILDFFLHGAAPDAAQRKA